MNDITFKKGKSNGFVRKINDQYFAVRGKETKLFKNLLVAKSWITVKGYQEVEA